MRLDRWKRLAGLEKLRREGGENTRLNQLTIDRRDEKVNCHSGNYPHPGDAQRDE